MHVRVIAYGIPEVRNVPNADHIADGLIAASADRNDASGAVCGERSKVNGKAGQ